MSKVEFRRFFESQSLHFVGKLDPFKLREGLTDQKLDLLWAMYQSGVMRFSMSKDRYEFRIG